MTLNTFKNGRFILDCISKNHHKEDDFEEGENFWERFRLFEIK